MIQRIAITLLLLPTWISTSIAEDASDLVPIMAVPNQKVVEEDFDNLSIWAVKSQSQSNWNQRKKRFPDVNPIQIKEPKKQ